MWNGANDSGTDIVCPMRVPIVLLDLVPVAGGVMCGLAAIFRGRILPRDARDSGGLMKFSPLGRLRCVCGTRLPAGVLADRRHFCRTCGCEVIAQDEARLSQNVSSREIRAMTKSLRRAASRSRHLMVPPSVTTVEELHRYLDGRKPKNECVPLPTRLAGRSGQFRSSPNVP
jgi:hypothetical protein